MSSYILILAGLIPSLAWLFFYLRYDCHPEPRKAIIKTFVLAILFAPLAVAGQLLFIGIIKLFNPEYIYESSRLFFAGAAFIEEAVKFVIVWIAVIRTADFDEPIDAMMYMIVAGLGFAALENILYFDSVYSRILFSHGSGVASVVTAKTALLRFFGATLLHVFASATMGYFLALSWFYSKHAKRIILYGLFVASSFHFLFNIILFEFRGSTSERFFNEGVTLSTMLLVGLMALTTYLFMRIRRLNEQAQLQ